MKHSTEQRSSAEWRSPLLRPLKEQTAIFASISKFTHLCNMQSNVLNDLAFKRLIGFFSPSNARWLSPARLSCQKYDCIVQIHQINAVATLVMMTMWVKREPELDRYGQLTGRGPSIFSALHCVLSALWQHQRLVRFEHHAVSPHHAGGRAVQPAFTHCPSMIPMAGKLPVKWGEIEIDRKHVTQKNSSNNGPTIHEGSCGRPRGAVGVA